MQTFLALKSLLRCEAWRTDARKVFMPTVTQDVPRPAAVTGRSGTAEHFSLIPAAPQPHHEFGRYLPTKMGKTELQDGMGLTQRETAS